MLGNRCYWICNTEVQLWTTELANLWHDWHVSIATCRGLIGLKFWRCSFGAGHSRTDKNTAPPNRRERASRLSSVLSKLDDLGKRHMPDSHVEERICAPKSSLPSLPKLCTSKSTNYQKKEFGEDTSTVWHFESQTRGWSQLPKKNCIRLDNHFSSGTKYSNFSYQGRCSHLWVVYITNGDYHDSTACSKFDIHLAGHSFSSTLLPWQPTIHQWESVSAAVCPRPLIVS